jgi:hypothetical protein
MTRTLFAIHHRQACRQDSADGGWPSDRLRIFSDPRIECGEQVGLKANLERESSPGRRPTSR